MLSPRRKSRIEAVKRRLDSNLTDDVIESQRHWKRRGYHEKTKRILEAGFLDTLPIETTSSSSVKENTEIGSGSKHSRPFSLLKCGHIVKRPNQSSSSVKKTTEIGSGSKHSRPLLLKCGHIVKRWPAWAMWTGREQSSPVMEYEFWVGEGDTTEEEEVTIRLSDLFAYAAIQSDDLPLYIFDRDFCTRAQTSSGRGGECAHSNMKLGYNFDSIRESMHLGGVNLLQCNGEEEAAETRSDVGREGMKEDVVRSPYRWFLAGPQNSGTDPHRDPRGTFALNALLRGRKLWALLSPQFSKEDAWLGSSSSSKERSKEGDEMEEDTPSSYWFTCCLPKLLQCEDRSPHSIRIFLQHEGDVVYVPPGWTHAVWNLDNVNVAVTENFVIPEMYFALKDRFLHRERGCGGGVDMPAGDVSWEQFLEWYYGLYNAKTANEWIRKCECDGSVAKLLGRGI